MNWSKTFVTAGVLVCGVAVLADIKYTTVTAFSTGTTESKSSTTRAVKPNFERYESSSAIGNYNMEQITIRECGKKQTIKLESQLKIYAVVPDENNSGATAPQSKPSADKPGKPTAGKMVMTYDVQDLGVEEVAGFKTRHYMVDIQIQSSGCAGDSNTKQKYEIWVADIRQPDACPAESANINISDAMSRSDCKMEVVQLGDFKEYAEIGKGLTVRQKIYSGDKLLMTTEVTSLSQAKLGDELFTIPADYKKVTPEEFQTQQTAAMMKAMTGGHTPDDEE